MPPIPTPTAKELLLRIKKFIPPLLEPMHKGQQGRVAVIGGSEDYTGAPFFSANASALLGMCLQLVSTEASKLIESLQVIKTYSPNLMVHPYMRQSHNRETDMETAKEISSKIAHMLDRLHALVIGPGLGRDPLMLETAENIIEEARKRGMPFVVDADGLFLVQNKPSVIQGYTYAILTPNVAEFARLCKSMGIERSDGDETEVCSRLAKAFGGVTILQKGPKDYISNGKQTMVCDIKGGQKRSGGQGDTLTGCLVTFLAWKKAYQDKLWDHDNSLSDSELIALSAYGASALTRNCSRLAYEKKGRSLQASDLSMEVGNAFQNLFEDDEPKL